MKKRLISLIIAAITAFSAIPSMAEETGEEQTGVTVEKTVYPSDYVFAGNETSIKANANRVLVNTSIITREGSNNAKYDAFGDSKRVILYNMYYYPAFEIEDAYAISDIKLNALRHEGSANIGVGYLISDKFILEGIESGEYYDTDDSDLYETVRGYYSGGSPIMKELGKVSVFDENNMGVMDVSDDVISQLAAAEEINEKVVLNLCLKGLGSVAVRPATVCLTITYDFEKILKKELSQLETAEDIEAIYVKYNENIGVNLSFFDDMSEVYQEIFEWVKDTSEEEYTFSELRNVFDKTVKNLVVKNSEIKVSDFAGKEVEITSDGYTYAFDNEYTSEDSFSTYMTFDVKDSGNKFLFAAGGVNVTIGEGKITLSDGNNEAVGDISDDFCGTVVLKFLSDGKVIAVAANSEERRTVEFDADNFVVQTVVFESDNNAKVSDFVLQQYPKDYEKAATDALDEVSGLLDEGKRDEAIEAYDSAAEMALNMADGIVKKELGLYSELLLARVNYAKEQAKYENAVEAFENALTTNKYEDYLAAEEIASSITDKELAESANAKLLEVKAEFAKIVPHVTSVAIEGIWKVGETLTAKVTMEDDCGNGDGYECVWLLNGSETEQTGENFNVLASHAGKKIVLQVIPKNNQGIKGVPKESLAATIQKASSGSSGGGSSSKGSSVVYNVPAQKAQQAVEEIKITNKIENEGTIFNDIIGHWAEESINNMMKKSIVKGVTAYEFAPEREITRAEFVTLLLRALNKEEKEYNGEFADVEAGDWYANTVKTAYDLGLISGFAGLFNPNGLISRQEMAKLLVLAYELENEEIAVADISYNDAADISDWAQIFVKKANSAKIMLGDDSGCFNPTIGATRAEATVAIERFLNK